MLNLNAEVNNKLRKLTYFSVGISMWSHLEEITERMRQNYCAMLTFPNLFHLCSCLIPPCPEIMRNWKYVTTRKKKSFSFCFVRKSHLAVVISCGLCICVCYIKTAPCRSATPLTRLLSASLYSFRSFLLGFLRSKNVSVCSQRCACS
jgi:hypothetical protein